MSCDFGYRIRLALALVILNGTAHVGSADSQAPANSTPLIPIADNSSNMTNASNSGAPIGYLPAADWRRTVVVQHEDSSPSRSRRSNRWHGRLFRTKPLQGLDWFHYIRGEGPAIWVHE